jgi:hypothetical protein
MIIIGFLWSALVVQSAIAQGERKLKQELFFHNGKNYMGISYDTLGKEYFRWMTENKATNIYNNQVRFITQKENETTFTTIYGKVKSNRKMKRELPDNFDGFITRNTKSYDGSNYTYQSYRLKFKNARLYYDLGNLLNEDISLSKTDSVVMRGSIPRSNYFRYFSDDDRPNDRIYHLSYRTDELNGKLIFSSKIVLDEGKINDEKNVNLPVDNIAYFQTYIKTDYYPYSNRYARSKEKRIEKFNEKGQMIEEELYELNKKEGFPNVFKKLSSVKYTYFEPYLERRERNCYNKRGKLCKFFTIEIKKSFY